MSIEREEREEREEKDTVSFVVKDNIAWVSFNRPEKRNCMSPKLNRRMMEVLDELEFREDVGVERRRDGVVRGDGFERIFPRNGGFGLGRCEAVSA